MPRDGLQQYAPPAGTQGVANYTVESARYNTFVSDITADQNNSRPIVAGGTGAANAAQAMVNLGGEIAGVIVTNYDSQVWQSGSFSSAAGATNAPVAGHAFIGIAYSSDPPAIPPANLNVVIEARDEGDTTVPGRKYIREKKAGVWGGWTLDGRFTSGTYEGISGVTADMFFGLNGTSPTSAFVVNTKADITGQNIFTVAKTGEVSVNAMLPNGDAVQYLSTFSGTGAQTLYGRKNNLLRWQLRLGNGGSETGSNVASDFDLLRYADGGAFLATAMSISRATGNAIFSGDVTSLRPAAAATGYTFFGNSGAKSLGYDGTNFQLSGGSLNVNAGTIVSSGFHQSTAKGNLFGSAAGTGFAGALTNGDANILFYNTSSTNWAGTGTDNSGNIWFRAGVSGTPASALTIQNDQNVVAGKFNSSNGNFGGTVGAPWQPTPPVCAEATVSGVWPIASKGVDRGILYLAGSASNIYGYFTQGTIANLVGQITGTTTTTTYGTTSDGRKKPLREAFSGLDIINRLNPVRHNWINEPDQWSYGVIAQEAVDVLPQMIIRGDDDFNRKSGEDGFVAWGADYSQGVPVLLRAVQELAAQNAELKARIEALEARA